MGRKLTGAKPKRATIYQRRWRKKAAREAVHGAAIRQRADVFSRLAEATVKEAARLGVMKVYSPRTSIHHGKRSCGAKLAWVRAAENHYRTTVVDELKALTPPAAKVATMFMWTTSTYLAWAMDLLTHWGFTYGGFVVWDKQIIGKDRRFRLQTELLLYGSKNGGLKPPAPRDREPNIISIRAIRKKGVHSAKPPEIRKFLADQYPDVSRVEMFSRLPPDEDFDVWGNEAPALTAALAEAGIRTTEGRQQ